MTGAITKGARVRITGGSRKGKTGEAVKPHAGQGFAGYWCIRIDGADWESPLFAAPVEALELI